MLTIGSRAKNKSHNKVKGKNFNKKSWAAQINMMLYYLSFSLKRKQRLLDTKSIRNACAKIVVKGTWQYIH